MGLNKIRFDLTDVAGSPAPYMWQYDDESGVNISNTRSWDSMIRVNEPIVYDPNNLKKIMWEGCIIADNWSGFGLSYPKPFAIGTGYTPANGFMYLTNRNIYGSKTANLPSTLAQFSRGIWITVTLDLTTTNPTIRMYQGGNTILNSTLNRDTFFHITNSPRQLVVIAGFHYRASTFKFNFGEEDDKPFVLSKTNPTLYNQLLNEGYVSYFDSIFPPKYFFKHTETENYYTIVNNVLTNIGPSQPLYNDGFVNINNFKNKDYLNQLKGIETGKIKLIQYKYK